MDTNETDEARVSGILRSLTGEQVNELAGWINEKTANAVRKAIPAALEDFLENHGYSEEVAGMVQLIAAKTGDSQSEVLRKALTLYGVAVDASEIGNRMAILSPSDEIIREIIGVGSNEPSSMSLTK